QEHGVPTPAVVFPESREDVRTFASRAAFPVMLKAINPTRLERRTGHRLFVARTPEELLRHYAEWEEADAPNLMLQEYVPGDGATFRLFVDEQGMDVARFLYVDLTGQPGWLAPMRAGRKWIVEDADLDSSLVRARDGRLTLRGWIESLRGVEEGAWFARDDLRPLWRIGRQLIGRVLRGAARRLGAPPLLTGLARL